MVRYLKIQLEDIKDYKKALKYIGKLPFIEVCKARTNFEKNPYYSVKAQVGLIIGAVFQILTPDFLMPDSVRGIP